MWQRTWSLIEKQVEFSARPIMSHTPLLLSCLDSLEVGLHLAHGGDDALVLVVEALDLEHGGLGRAGSLLVPDD